MINDNIFMLSFNLLNHLSLEFVSLMMSAANNHRLLRYHEYAKSSKISNTALTTHKIQTQTNKLIYICSRVKSAVQ